MTRFDEMISKVGFEVSNESEFNAYLQHDTCEASITDKSGYFTITIYYGYQAGKINAKIIKVNGTSKWYYDKTEAQMMSIIRQCMEGYDWTKPTKAEAIEAMDDDAEDPSVTLDEFIAKAQKIDNMKEEETMKPTTAKIGDQIKVGATTYTIAKIFYASYFSKEGWMIEFTDTNGGYHYWKQYLDGGEFIPATEDTTTTNNEEEETMNLTEGVAKFTKLDGTTYTYHIDSKRYAKTINGKTTRIGKAEYEAAKHEYDLEREMCKPEDVDPNDPENAYPTDEEVDAAQAELDKSPCRVEVNSDLYKPAVLNQYGCVDCSKCNVTGCVHRNCMRRNPRSEGGLGECPRLDVEPDGAQDPELEQIMDETGLEASDAELERNIRNEQKKPRKSKDIAYEGHGKTLTAKQVDFILHLSDSCFWENGLESTLWTDVLCDEIRGQFEGKPMTVGAMISTLCEKGLAERAKDKINNRTATYMVLTELGKEIAKELGLE